MRILNVNTSLGLSEGGTSERTYQMSLYLWRAGEDVAILVNDKGFDPALMGSFPSDRVIALPLLNSRYLVPRVTPASIRTIVREFDVIHLMNHWSFLNALVYVAARALRKPYVVCPAGALRIYGRSKFFKRCYNAIIGKRIIRNAQRVIAITDDERPVIHDYGVDRSRVIVIPNAINTDDYLDTDDGAFREQFHIGGGPFVLFLGRLNPIKGPDLLLEAFCLVKDQIPQFSLVYAGPDEGMLQSLQTRARACGVENRVHFVGLLGKQDKSRALHGASFLAIPSRHEAMSIVALEAGACGTPVLLTDRCGFNEVERIRGGIVKPATAEGLCEGLMRMAQEDLASMGDRLKTYCVSRHSWQTNVRTFIDVYSGIVERERRLPRTSDENRES